MSIRERADPQDRLQEGTDVGLRSATEPVQQRERGERANHLIGIEVRDRRDADGDVAQQFHGEPPPPHATTGPNTGSCDDADEHLDTTVDHLLDENPSSGSPTASTRRSWPPLLRAPRPEARPSRTAPDSVLCNRADGLSATGRRYVGRVAPASSGVATRRTAPPDPVAVEQPSTSSVGANRPRPSAGRDEPASSARMSTNERTVPASRSRQRRTRGSRHRRSRPAPGTRTRGSGRPAAQLRPDPVRHEARQDRDPPVDARDRADDPRRNLGAAAQAVGCRSRSSRRRLDPRDDPDRPPVVAPPVADAIMSTGFAR